ncbi:uncharacterized protein A1O5_04830 [Cladophialophora psammophila CBS 110553]|uniref:Uncharacterized protein n=1 Tax=Cladophialophora psammophila CBS 110553 TaxID=1182543 RepID=W9X5X0_9EURO|nr:uncharacterized protein A1O5_04830 [Cladophialophora psammophila CBS 110553]EXJ72326.1 hypothetical protein A1O5_04830 [Cladophialophora psammophila CBS 110553]
MALSLLRNNPSAWFRDATIGTVCCWLPSQLHSSTTVKYHMVAGESFQSTNWMVEDDDACKELVRSAGARLYGVDNGPCPSVHWTSVKVNVNISGTPGSGFLWGSLSPRPDNIRIFKEPADACALHGCEAMILRDCTASTDMLIGIDSIAERTWDILCMKMSEDYDYPWMAVAVKDAGPLPDLDSDSCGCQDPSACGCIIIG